MLENINTKIEGLSSSVKYQLSFNKMIEIQIAQIAATTCFWFEKDSEATRNPSRIC